MIVNNLLTKKILLIPLLIVTLNLSFMLSVASTERKSIFNFGSLFNFSKAKPTEIESSENQVTNNNDEKRQIPINQPSRTQNSSGTKEKKLAKTSSIKSKSSHSKNITKTEAKLDGYVDVDPIVLNCSTSFLLNPKQGEPKKFRSSNDLTREVGDFSAANGHKILIIGRVMDKNCVPIGEMPIKIWQVESNGNYSSRMSGTATSDNLGRFQFLTSIQDEHKMPYIAIKVKSNKEIKKYSFFFEGHYPSFASKLSNHQKASVTMISKEGGNMKYYFLDLVLDDVQQFKTF